MAMRNLSRGIPRLWKDGYKQFSGLEEAILKNCEAATSLAELVRTSFGPNGLSKIIINRNETVFVTTDAATIISQLEVQHPAAKVLCLAAQMQQQEIGDGANFVVIFAGELLKKATELLRIGIHPSDLVNGYVLAHKKSDEILKSLTVFEVNENDLKDKEKLVMSIKSTICSKQYGLEDILSNVVADACLNSMPENGKNFIVDNVRTVKIMGGSVEDCFVIKGMVLETRPKTSNNKIDNDNGCKVAVFTCSVDATQTESKGTVLLKNADELMNYNKSEEAHMHKVIKNLHDMGVGVVITNESLGDVALHFLDKYNMIGFKLVSKWALRRLCRALKAKPIVKLLNVALEDLGHVKKVYTKEIGSRIISVFEQSSYHESEVSTIVLRGATENVLEDLERAVDDGVNIVRSMVRNGKFVAGAGAVEVEMARQLKQYANTVSGLQQYAIEAYAQALEVVPRTLAENTGLNDSDIIAKLYAEHEAPQVAVPQVPQAPQAPQAPPQEQKQQTEQATDTEQTSSGKNIGVDIKGGGVRDMTTDGVIDLMSTREMGLNLATQAAVTILRVDHIIMKKPAGGPKIPKRGHWDANDDSW